MTALVRTICRAEGHAAIIGEFVSWKRLPQTLWSRDSSRTMTLLHQAPKAPTKSSYSGSLGTSIFLPSVILFLCLNWGNFFYLYGSASLELNRSNILNDKNFMQLIRRIIKRYCAQIGCQKTATSKDIVPRCLSQVLSLSYNTGRAGQRHQTKLVHCDFVQYRHLSRIK